MKDFFAKYQNSPMMAVGLAVAIALIMVVSTTTIFFKSNAYATVKQIQAGVNASTALSDGVDTTSPIKASDIDDFYNSFVNRMQNFNDYNDYGPQALSNQNLGL